MLRFERDSLELYDLIEELRECDAPGLFFVFFGGSAGQLTDRLEYEKRFWLAVLYGYTILFSDG